VKPWPWKVILIVPVVKVPKVFTNHSRRTRWRRKAAVASPRHELVLAE